MPPLPVFAAPGNWYKGNLHTHTDQSDGKIGVAGNLAWHAGQGYDFVAVTDHNRLTLPSQHVTVTPLLAIPSVEISARRGKVDYHIISLGLGEMPVEKYSDPQAVIDSVNAAGGLCFIAHPYWHDHLPQDLLSLSGHVGIEIFNTSCWLEIQKGHSLVHWDAVLRRGQKAWGFATDDSHFGYPDYGRGWIVVKSERLDQGSILAAIRQGHFYASMGPRIEDIQVDGRQVLVRCSPAKSIYAIGDSHHCPFALQAWDGEPLTEAVFHLPANQKYLRVEVVDMESQSAWSNPIFFEEA